MHPNTIKLNLRKGEKKVEVVGESREVALLTLPRSMALKRISALIFIHS
jgi:hypothetical protein